MLIWPDDFINKIITGHALDVLKQMPDECVDAIITSPPYHSLRDYGEEAKTVWGGDPKCEHEWQAEITKQDNLRFRKGHNTTVGNNKKAEIYSNNQVKSAFCKKCKAWLGQLGLEPTLDLYIEHLLQVTAELKRVLKPTGVMFWNHGDCYNNGDMQQQNEILVYKMRKEQGWRLANRIIWYKPNHMPESVKRRFTNAYEPVYLLFKAKRPKDIWFDLDAVRVPFRESTIQKAIYEVKRIEKYNGKVPYEKLKKGAFHKKAIFPKQLISDPLHTKPYHLGGKNPGDVWNIATQPFPEAHFACADMFTEILTKDGWKKWNEVVLNDKIATLDILDETICYHEPYAIYRYKYKGNLVVIENQWVAQYVTPNHRVLLKYIHSAIQRRPDDFWHYERADNMRPYSGVLIPLSGKYKGELDIGSTEKAELLGWILTEGCLSSLKKGKGITIYQSNDANPDKVKRIEELLQKCNINYTRIDRKRNRSVIRGKEYIRHEVCFYIKKRGQNWQWILEWINEDKTPKWKLLHIKYRQLKALYKGIIAGDGHHRKDGRDSFTQKDEYIREWFRTLCIHLGKRTTEYNKPRLRSTTTVFITNKNYAQIHESDFKECVKRVRYEGIVWCPHLPNTNFVARRKGNDGQYRYFITGNTFPEKLVEPLIKCGCPQYICRACGKARERIVENPKEERFRYDCSSKQYAKAKHGEADYYRGITIGWTDCGCNAGWEGGVVLDPFIGSGTTALVALRLGRKFIGIDINPKYCEMVRKRIEPELNQLKLQI